MVSRLPASRQIGFADERAAHGDARDSIMLQVFFDGFEATPTTGHDDGNVELARKSRSETREIRLACWYGVRSRMPIAADLDTVRASLDKPCGYLRAFALPQAPVLAFRIIPRIAAVQLHEHGVCCTDFRADCANALHGEPRPVLERATILV